MHNPMMKKMAPATTPVVAGPGAPAAVGGDDLDLPGIAAMLRAHWPSVLAVMGATLLLGLLLALLKQPEYVSTGVISVAEPPAIGARTKGKTPRADPRSGGRDVALLRSRRLAVRVLQALAPSTMLQLGGDRAATFKACAALVRRLPAYHLFLGEDPQEIAATIAGFITEGAP